MAEEHELQYATLLTQEASISNDDEQLNQTETKPEAGNRDENKYNTAITSQTNNKITPPFPGPESWERDEKKRIKFLNVILIKIKKQKVDASIYEDGEINLKVDVDGKQYNGYAVHHKGEIYGIQRIICPHPQGIPNVIQYTIGEEEAVSINYAQIESSDAGWTNNVVTDIGIRTSKSNTEHSKYELHQECVALTTTIRFPEIYADTNWKKVQVTYSKQECIAFLEGDIDDCKKIELKPNQMPMLRQTTRDMQIFYCKSNNMIYCVSNELVEKSIVFCGDEYAKSAKNRRFGLVRKFVWYKIYCHKSTYPQAWVYDKYYPFFHQNITEAVWICARYNWIKHCLYGQDNEFNIFRSLCFVGPYAGFGEVLRLSIGVLCLLLQVILSVGIVWEVVETWDNEMFSNDVMIWLISIIAFSFLSYAYSFTVRKYYEFYENMHYICDISWFIVILDFTSNIFIGFVICCISFFYLLQSPSMTDVVLNSFALAFVIELDDFANLWEADEDQLMAADWEMLGNENIFYPDWDEVSRKRKIGLDKWSFMSIPIILLSPFFIFYAFFANIYWMVRYLKTRKSLIVDYH